MKFQCKINALLCMLFGLWLSTALSFAAPKRHYVCPPELSWTKEEWTGSDKPFMGLRRNIDQLISKGNSPDDLLNKYKQLAQQDPKDAQTQFRWAYAADRAALKQHNGAEIEKRLSGVAEALAKPDSPESYQYGRMRYLMEVRGITHSSNGFVVEFGKRLVKRNPKDWDVKFFLISQLLNSEDVNDRRVTAVKYAYEVQTAYPKRPSSYSILGWVYQNLHWGTHDPRHADISIANYRKYLQLAPKNYEFRKSVPRIIKSIEKDKARYLAEKKKPT